MAERIEANQQAITDLVAQCAQIVGASNFKNPSEDLSAYEKDWTGKFEGSSLGVARPDTVEQVSDLVKLCAQNGIAVVPQSGRTGLCGGGVPLPQQPSLILSLERMNAIRQVNTAARTVTVEAGVILENLHDEAARHGLVFPLLFGAKGSCMIGGNLSTNAGGSNVVRYGNTRELCLGIEAVMPDGTIINNLTGLRKDNTGYDIKDLLIGAEGTLGVITAAVFKLFPEPLVRSTAFLSVPSMSDAITILNRLQDRTGGCVEAYEYMPRPMVDVVCKVFPDMRLPLDASAEIGIFVEVASSRKDDAQMGEDGSRRLEEQVLEVLGELMEEALVEDAMIAQSEQQRADLWRLRESVLEAMTENGPVHHLDISLPLANIATFLETMDPIAHEMGFQPLNVGHLGDGNLHYTFAPADGRDWSDLPLDEAMQKALELTRDLNGSFSAEHGIGQSKLDLMRQMKDPGQLATMRLLKTALDPKGIMNPGKLVPLD